MQFFSADAFYFDLFCAQKFEKTPQKVAYLWQLGVFFLSAATTAPNSSELHFRFMNSFIQSSLLESLLTLYIVYV